MENKKQVSTVKVNPIDTSTFRYNPMIVQLQTNEVKTKTREHYFAQIKDNFYVGVKSAFLIVKNTTEAGNGWQIFDNKRDTFNVATSTLFSNLNNAEGTDTSFDVLSNGIKMKQGFGSKNKNANVYIYMAFAEQPLVTSTGVPATAR